MQQSDDQILATLRDTDRDRYLACLLSPAEKRHSLAALYAFYAEIARVRDMVKEPLPGEIRLQWWRDTLENEQSDGAGHPLAEALLRCIREHHLPVRVLQDMIDARIFDLYDDPMQDRAALEGYAGETASALIQLSSLILTPTTQRGLQTQPAMPGLLRRLPVSCCFCRFMSGVAGLSSCRAFERNGPRQGNASCRDRRECDRKGRSRLLRPRPRSSRQGT